jgi:Ribonuclease G/E
MTLAARVFSRMGKILRDLRARWLKSLACRRAEQGGRQERLRRTAEQLSRQCDDLKRRMLAARENR